MKKPFTLVEVLVAMSVLAVFMLGLMQFFSSTDTMLSSGIERIEMFERARIAMDMMANDLACVYYSQTDKDLTPYESSGKSFRVSTVRAEKPTKDDDSKPKTNIVGVKYQWNKSDLTLVYSYDKNGDTFDVSDDFGGGTETDLVEGVTDFEVTEYYGDGEKRLPALVVIQMEMVDARTLRRFKASKNNGVSTDGDDTAGISESNPILKNAPRRQFRRMVIIDRGQSKKDLRRKGSGA